MKVDEITGGAPYGATPIAGLDAQRRENKLPAPGAKCATMETAAKLNG
jgi:NAD(P)H dehydrogenase (quinone)